eukprot:TRINITY_DN2763_c0_g1_i2.p2 TRINITY_DN2763_c0_g1~~TRINITY_DN2763_c0_g1_i2.p2  ORF type:complete len:119 (+),score=5.53 TRINITY_DN2763_c0_g1_i2:87-443(+)
MNIKRQKQQEQLNISNMRLAKLQYNRVKFIFFTFFHHQKFTLQLFFVQIFLFLFLLYSNFIVVDLACFLYLLPYHNYRVHCHHHLAHHLLQLVLKSSHFLHLYSYCLLYTSPSPRDQA